MCSISKERMLPILFMYIFQHFSVSCKCCCITGPSTVKKDNFHISVCQKAEGVLFSNRDKASPQWPSTLLASASSEQLASREGGSSSKVGRHTEQVEDEGREPRKLLQNNICFASASKGCKSADERELDVTACPGWNATTAFLYSVLFMTLNPPCWPSK